MEEKKLKRSSNAVLCGVCAGIAEYFEMDPTVIRVLWALFSLCEGGGLLLYIVFALIMPKPDET